jgi:hypothetical protein
VEDTSLDEDEQFGLWTDGEGRTETESKRGAARPAGRRDCSHSRQVGGLLGQYGIRL